jgi:serine phosphatase RsbU (regulator of sigma subunit)
MNTFSAVIDRTDDTDDLIAHLSSGTTGPRPHGGRVAHDLGDEMREINERLVLSAIHQHSLHELLTAELERNRSIAEAMQYSILWRQPVKIFPGLTVASFYQPAAGDALVGGDFFDAFSLSPESVCLMVGDVTGKGLKAAARTVEVTFALRAFAHNYQHPAEAIRHLNEFICDFHRDDDGSIANALIVLSLIAINPITGLIQVVSAGAERPFILRASGAVEELAVQGLILGVDRKATYGALEGHLQAGDTLFMTTDGITEARRGSEFFGFERLVETARRASACGTPNDIGKAILQAVRDFSNGQLTDDICMIVMRRDRD